MAWYDDKANAGYGGVFSDTEGREHAVVGYAKAQNYVATSEQVFEYRKGIGRIEPYEDHGTRWRRPVANDRPLKDDGFPAKVHDHVGYGQNYKVLPHNRDARDPSRLVGYDQGKGSPRNKDASDPSRLAFYDQSKGLPWNGDASDPSQLAVYDQNKGSPKNRDASDPSKFSVHDQNKGSHWNRDTSNPSWLANYDQSKGSPRSIDASKPSRLAIYDQGKGSPQSRDANDPNRLVAHGQSKGSPRSKDAHKSSQFLSPNTYEIGKNNEFSDDEDDDICEDGVCYKRGGSKPINHLKGNSYPLGKDSYDEKLHDINEKRKGNGHVPSSYTAPITIPPRNDLHYDPSIHNNNGPIVNGPKPIQTRFGPDFPSENTRNSDVSIGMQLPYYNGSPRKDHGSDQSTYNKVSPLTGAYSGDKYKGIKINAKEAAKKYKGVLLTD